MTGQKVGIVNCLKLSNNENGLSYARCLLNSPCGIYLINPEDGNLADYTLEGTHKKWEDCEWDDNHFILSSNTHRLFPKHLLLPIESIVVDVFSCMREGVSVARTDQCNDSGKINLIRLESECEKEMIILSGGGKVNRGETSLCFENLPEGVELIEVKPTI